MSNFWGFMIWRELHSRRRPSGLLVLVVIIVAGYLVRYLFEWGVYFGFWTQAAR